MHTEPNPTTNTRGAPPPSTHEARRSADSRAAEAAHARDALAAAERAEAIAREAHEAATAAASDAAAEHAKAAAAVERAETSYAETQTSGAWSGVERARSLAAQAQLRAQRAAVAREAAASDLATAMRRAVAARTEYLRAEDAAQRAADVLRGLEHNARLADDAAAAREGARLRAVAAYHEQRAALSSRLDAPAPKLRAALDAAVTLRDAFDALDNDLRALRTEAARVAAAGRACGEVNGQAPPDLEPPAASDALGAALSVAGVGGILAPLARGAVSPALRPLLAAAGVEAHAGGPDVFNALVAEVEALHRETDDPRVGMACGDIARGVQRGEPRQTIALRAAAVLGGDGAGLLARHMHSTLPEYRAAVEAEAARARRYVDLALRLASPEAWR